MLFWILKIAGRQGSANAPTQAADPKPGSYPYARALSLLLEALRGRSFPRPGHTGGLSHRFSLRQTDLGNIRTHCFAAKA
jgi:hypothetical protein